MYCVLKGCHGIPKKLTFGSFSMVKRNISSFSDFSLIKLKTEKNSIELFVHVCVAGLKLDAIGLVLDKTTNHTLEAFVRFATSNDFDLALKRNWELMGNR